MHTNAPRFAMLGAFALTAGCDPSPATGRDDDEPDLLRGTDSSREFGDYVVYVTALTTDQLLADIASEYGIVRSSRRAMLTVSVRKKEPGNVTSPVRGAVSVSAVNLSGQLRALTLREIAEGDAIYYIGEIPLDNSDTLLYTINILPAEEGAERLSLRYQKQFVVER